MPKAGPRPLPEKSASPRPATVAADTQNLATKRHWNKFLVQGLYLRTLVLVMVYVGEWAAAPAKAPCFIESLFSALPTKTGNKRPEP